MDLNKRLGKLEFIAKRQVGPGAIEVVEVWAVNWENGTEELIETIPVGRKYVTDDKQTIGTA